MEFKTLGKIPIKVSELGFGGASLLSHCGRSSSIKAINDAFDQGINLFDTADYYGQGDSETLLGQTLGSRRKEITLVSKGGLSFYPDTSKLKPLKQFLKPYARKFKGLLSIANKIKQNSQKASLPPQQQIHQVEQPHNFNKNYINNAIDQSLSRLQTDHIDIYLLHTPPLTVLREGSIFDVLQENVKKGKIRFFGASCNSAEECLAALSHIHKGVSMLELPVNILEQEAIKKTVSEDLSHPIGLLARSPFATGQIFQIMKKKAPSPREKQIMTALQSVMSESGLTLQETCIKYSLSFPEVGTLICSMLNPPHLKNNLTALKKPPLTKDQINQLSL